MNSTREMPLPPDFIYKVKQGKWKGKWRVKHGTWNDEKNHRILLEWIGKKLGYTKPEDWYNIQLKDIKNNYGDGLITTITNKEKNFNYLSFIVKVFPEFNLNINNFQYTPKNYWKNPIHSRQYGKKLEKKLGYTKPEDWYNISLADFNNNKGGGVISRYYRNSPRLFAQFMYPNYEWYQWKFLGGVPDNYWEDIKEQKIFTIWLGKKLGYTKPEHWYNIRKEIISKNGGSNLLSRYYNNSPQLFVKSMFPEETWDTKKFAQVINGYWKDIENQKYELELLANELGYTKPEHWYKLTWRIARKYVYGLLSGTYNNSVCLMIETVYSDIDWMPWMFAHTPNNWWNNIENKKKFMKWFKVKMGIQKKDDWYKVGVRDFYSHKGHQLLRKYNYSRTALFKEIFPEETWDSSKFWKNYSKQQIEWLEFLKITISDIQHAENNEEGEFKIPNSRYTVDGYSRKNNLVLEYHGDFWHGNPKIHNPTDINAVSKKTFGELYNNTVKKQLFCEDAGFICIYIWESEWLRGKNALRMIQRAFKNK